MSQHRVSETTPEGSYPPDPFRVEHADDSLGASVVKRAWIRSSLMGARTIAPRQPRAVVVEPVDQSARAGYPPGLGRLGSVGESRSVRLRGGHERAGEQVGGSAPVERLAWPAVHLDGDPLKLCRGEGGQVAALGEVVAQEAVHVLVASALPR
jgi:hypothetical protein